MIFPSCWVNASQLGVSGKAVVEHCKPEVPVIVVLLYSATAKMAADQVKLTPKEASAACASKP